MKDGNPSTIYLKNYTPSPFDIKHVNLTFDLDETATVVTAQIDFQRNKQSNKTDPLVLDGYRLKLNSVKLDGKELTENDYKATDSRLVVENVPENFSLETVVTIDPLNNQALEGLYKSGNIFCTQCEPEGFRAITYFLDRSDVMTKYTTKIIADKKKYPVLLSNGNPVGQGELSEGKHWATWEDPFKKPSYLFALVAGDLGLLRDEFITRSGRTIDCRIYCDKGNENRCDFAMQALKKSMKWDEERFGLEYDLDIYMIVAVDAFNMGAMENKGLNVFNTACVLANSETATDDDYMRVENVIGHEYFHNWTGNRITCRDWFQLTLKEGLTVFRDQEFSSDLHSRAVQRINDVTDLRTLQFNQDAGPTAHPIRPDSYIEINNFYTATVYNKGAEVIRMVHTLIGEEKFQQGMKKYIELYDGQAVTTEDFIHAMELGSGRDLSQFKRWYHQAGTPILDISYKNDGDDLRVTVRQSCPATPGQATKDDFHMPLQVCVFNKKGDALPRCNKVLELTQKEETFSFKNVGEDCFVSLNRNFSAPVIIKAPYTRKDLAFLSKFDNDPFAKWEALQKLGEDTIDQVINGKKPQEFSDLVASWKSVLQDSTIDNSFRALCMSLPSEAYLAQSYSPIDYDGIRLAREGIRELIANELQTEFIDLFEKHQNSGSYHMTSEDAGRRAVMNASLNFLVKSDADQFAPIAFKQYKEANNMTDIWGSLIALNQVNHFHREEALDHFYSKWKHDPLVLLKYIALQTSSILKDALKRTINVTKDPAFRPEIPNMLYATFRGYGRNFPEFHRVDGKGYEFVTDWILKLDSKNPQIAAGILGAFEKYADLDQERQNLIKGQLQRVIATPNLSKNAFEIANKILS